MGERAFLVMLDDDNWLRISFQTHRGAVVRFLVQYEAWIDDCVHVISRYDNAHGFSHHDIFTPQGRRKRLILATYSNDQVLTMAQNDFKANWTRYRQRYERRMTRR